MGEPTKRQWLGFWSMIVQQTQNAFNDKAAQFILIPLAGAVAYELHLGEISGKSISISAESAAGLMIALPFVLFAPLAGWMSDRFSKRNVILGAAIAQVAILALICVAVFSHRMPLALLGFFLLAAQSAFFSPAKIGINKELVGSKHLGFAAGVQQMTAMLAILAGQIVSGWWFDRRYEAAGAVKEMAWDAAFTPLFILTLFSVPAVLMAISIPKVSAHHTGKLSAKLLFSHFKDLGELWREPGLRRASLGVAYFWGFAAFINLWSVKVAKSLTSGGEGFGTISSMFMAAASLGMAAGFGFASWLLRKRIELGWVPLAGLMMTVSALVLAFLPAGGWLFLICLGLLAFSAALFLAPLNAWMQDHYPADKRGELQSAVNLQDCFAGILSVAAIEGMIQLAGLLGMGELAGFRMQMVVIGLSCGLMSWFVLRILPADFIRLLCVGAVKFIYRIKLTGTPRIPETGGALLLPNHVTFADAFFLSAASDRPLRFVMDETFMASRVIRFSVRLFAAVPIRRDQPLEAIRKTIAALEDGHLVVLFPEGQLTRSGGLCEIERGFELIARKAKVPIIPLWVDGSWGSVFSFERGRFFRKTPYTVPYGLSIAVGEEITSEKPTCAELQAALMKTSSDAVALRFAKGASAAQLSAYRMTQLEAIPRGARLHILEGELPSSLIASLEGFAEMTRGHVVKHACFGPLPGGHWIGGETLRQQIADTDRLDNPITFHDFGANALLPLGKENLTHLPCYAVGGDVISMSMPHPAKPLATSTFQAGHKPGSWGKILPGFYLSGANVFPGNLPLPAGAGLDEEGFLVKT
jgi:acyl-[acyl-carrier-protein]-phospholipid O-acyltransferase / long-chain-fatty-acid--[acyl-carrier-protein] ligase